MNRGCSISGFQIFLVFFLFVLLLPTLLVYVVLPLIAIGLVFSLISRVFFLIKGKPASNKRKVFEQAAGGQIIDIQAESTS